MKGRINIQQVENKATSNISPCKKDQRKFRKINSAIWTFS